MSPGDAKVRLPRLTFLLEAGLDPMRYEERWTQGLVPDRLPYGTEHVPTGWSFDFAARPTPVWLTRVSRRLRRVFGFNLVHAFINRRHLRAADYIYCHTEVEYLAAAAVLLWHPKPVLVGQTIWLFRRFDELSGPKRWITRRLLRRVDIFVANATTNHMLGMRIAPKADHRYVPFGISRAFAVERGKPTGPDVLGVGNDIARDWTVFGEALARFPEIEVRVASKAAVRVGEMNVSKTTDSTVELIELYRTAQIVVVTVTENAHASGITTLLEAVGASTPAIVTRTGGLDDYFDDHEVTFIPPGSANALAGAIRSLLDDPERRQRMAAAARRAQDTNGYWNDLYWARVTEALLSRGGGDRSRAG